mgnify:CR=1 FL=1
MKVIKYPTKDQWTELLKRPALNTESLFDTVRSIIDKVLSLIHISEPTRP